MTREHMRQNVDSPVRMKVINYSCKISFLHKSGGVTGGKTDCRLFCVQRGNGGGWLWHLD